jgi:hypothetical protein
MPIVISCALEMPSNTVVPETDLRCTSSPRSPQAQAVVSRQAQLSLLLHQAACPQVPAYPPHPQFLQRLVYQRDGNTPGATLRVRVVVLSSLSQPVVPPTPSRTASTPVLVLATRLLVWNTRNNVSVTTSCTMEQHLPMMSPNAVCHALETHKRSVGLVISSASTTPEL